MFGDEIFSPGGSENLDMEQIYFLKDNLEDSVNSLPVEIQTKIDLEQAVSKSLTALLNHPNDIGLKSCHLTLLDDCCGILASNGGRPYVGQFKHTVDKLFETIKKSH